MYTYYYYYYYYWACLYFIQLIILFNHFLNIYRFTFKKPKLLQTGDENSFSTGD